MAGSKRDTWQVEELNEMRESLRGIVANIVSQRDVLEKFDLPIPQAFVDSFNEAINKASSIQDIQEIYNDFQQSPYMRSLAIEVGPLTSKVRKGDEVLLAKLWDDTSIALRSMKEDIKQFQEQAQSPRNELDLDLLDEKHEVIELIDQYLKVLDKFLASKSAAKKTTADEPERTVAATALYDELYQQKKVLEKNRDAATVVTVLGKVHEAFAQAIQQESKKVGVSLKEHKSIAKETSPVAAEQKTLQAQLPQRGWKSKISKMFSGVPSYLDILGKYNNKEQTTKFSALMTKYKAQAEKEKSRLGQRKA